MLKLSVKGEYGVLAVLALSLHEEAVPLSAKSIATRENLSVRFLEQAMNTLKEQGLIESVRGPHGGYRIARSPKETKLFDVLQAVEGKKSVARSKRAPLSSKAKILNEVITGANTAVNTYLNAIDFDDLSRRARALEEKEAPMFYI